MLDAKRLRTLQAVVRMGSLARAAEELGYTPSAVSQQIAELERAVGARVIERRPLHLTEAGRVALRAADVATEALQAGAEELRALCEGRTGTVHIGAFASAAAAVAAPAIGRLARARPDVAFALAQVEPPEAFNAVVRRRLDLAITFDYDLAPCSAPDGLTSTPLADDPVLAAVPAGHPLADRRSVSLRRLADERWIAAPLAGLPLITLRELARDAGFRPHVRFDGDDFRTVLALVGQGLGVALMPRLALSAAPPTISVVPLVGEPLTRRLHVTKLGDRELSPAAAALEAELRRGDL